jgi:cell division protein ZipA
MDLDLRIWLMMLGSLVVGGILVHGYLRMRGGDKLKMSLDRQYVNSDGAADVPGADELALLKAELPNGGARVVLRPEQSSLDLPADLTPGEVPVLVEAVDSPRLSGGPAERPFAGDAASGGIPSSHATGIIATRPVRGSTPPDPSTRADEDGGHVPAAAPEPGLTARAVPEWRGDNPASVTGIDSRQREQPSRGPEKFIVIHVLSEEVSYPVQRLIETLVDCGLEHGPMEVFHRRDDHGTILFSLANAVEPGTFDLRRAQAQVTPGVLLFMKVHELASPIIAYDQMLRVAERIAAELGGSVRDESRSALTTQTRQHDRQSIQDYQLKYG